MPSAPIDDSFGMSSPVVQFSQEAIVLSSPDGRILRANPAACALLHRTEEELCRSEQADILDHVEPPFADAWAKRFETGVFRGELACRLPDGTTIPIEVAANSFAASDGRRLVMMTLRDIRTRRAAAEALRESERRYRTLTDTIVEGIVYHSADGAILAANPSASRILGLSADQLAGRTSFDPRWRAIHEDGSPFPGQNHPAMVSLRTGEPSDAIMGVHKPDETLTWIAVHAEPLQASGAPKPTGVVATFADITAQRGAEEERERLAALVRARMEKRLALLDVAQQLAAKVDHEELLAAFAAHATRIAGADHAAILQWNPEDRTLTTVSSTTPREPLGRVHAGLAGPHPYGLGGLAIEQGQPVVVEDYAAAMADQPDADGHALGARATAAFPLRYEGRLLGVLMVWMTRPGWTFDTDEIEMLQLLGGLSAAHFVGIEATQLATVAMSARTLMHSLNGLLALAIGLLDMISDDPDLPASTRDMVAEATGALYQAADQITRFAHVNRFETMATPMGPALDLDASTGWYSCAPGELVPPGQARAEIRRPRAKAVTHGRPPGQRATADDPPLPARKTA